MTSSRRPISVRLACLLAAALTLAAVSARPDAARAAGLTAGEAVGAWDLSFERGNRRCRLMLRGDPVAAGSAVAMPVGCHRAFPLLASVAAWTPGPGDHIVLRTAAGQPVLDFGPSGGPQLSTLVGEEADLYVLAPSDPAVAATLAQVAEEATVPPPASPPARGAAAAGPDDGVLVDSSTPATGTAPAAAAMLPPPTTAEVAGHYAVIRQNRDTGCMVTLEEQGGARADLKARLAPACRDQGIVIFDPAGWQLSKGQLVLTAKKGHKAILTRRPDRTWATAPSKGTALVLKRL